VAVVSFRYRACDVLRIISSEVESGPPFLVYFQVVFMYVLNCFFPRHFQSENILPAYCDFPAVFIVLWAGEEKRLGKRREEQR